MYNAGHRFRPDLILSVYYRLILPDRILELAPQGAFNFHPSLLPRHRGCFSAPWAIIQGDRETGVTIMQMAEGLDTGDMLCKRSTEITATDTAASLHDRLADMGAGALLEVLAQIEAGQLQPEVQDESQVTYASKLSKAEAVIDWQLDAPSIVRMIQGFNPWTVAQTRNDETVLRIWEARLGEASIEGKPGMVLEEDKKLGILVSRRFNAPL